VSKRTKSRPSLAGRRHRNPWEPELIALPWVGKIFSHRSDPGECGG
jgi:hypothetical protein